MIPRLSPIRGIAVRRMIGFMCGDEEIELEGQWCHRQVRGRDEPEDVRRSHEAKHEENEGCVDTH